jgi:hypothetical protein
MERREGEVKNADRDRAIERLLRHPGLSDREAPGSECPDVETLAALADDALGTTARRDAETHIADCGRCQALMAAMVRAEPAAEHAAGSSRAAFSWWRRGSLGWIATAAAATTAVALWIAVPGQRAPLGEQAAPELAKSEEQVGAATLTEGAAAPPAPSAGEAPAAPLRDARGARADEPRPSEGTGGIASEPATRLGRAAAPPAQANAIDEAKVAAPAATSLEARRSDNSDAFRQREATAGRQESDGSGQARSQSAELAERALQAPASPALAAKRATGALADARVEIVSPDPAIRWRIGPGSLVQYSADSGATWTTQQTVGADRISAGSSPSPTVCWLVGSAGTVLRTTDGGRSWQRLPFPDAVDLVSVTGTSPLGATVQLADKRRMGTTDGGRTWAPLSD